MFTWTRKLFATKSSTKPQTGLRFRPMVDGLEDRFQPSTLQGLGAAGQFAVLGFGGGEVNLCNASVDGDVALGTNQTSRFRNSVVTGSLVADPTATLKPNGLTTGSTLTASLADAVFDARSASAAYAALTPTQSIGTLNQSMSITGNGGTNVINVNSVNFRRGDVLTLAGGPDDVFVFNVTGDFFFRSGAIMLDADVPVERVLFNVPTSGSAVEVCGENSVWKGTILAPNRGIEDKRTGDFTGALIGRSVAVRAGDRVHHAPFTPPDVSTTPATLSGRLTTNFGSGLEGVNITLTNEATLQTFTATTDADGYYTFGEVEAGTYTISLSADELSTFGSFDLGDATAGLGATHNGTAGVGTISGVTLGDGDLATGFDFLAVQQS